jgi:hypothetical protein
MFIKPIFLIQLSLKNIVTIVNKPLLNVAAILQKLI